MKMKTAIPSISTGSISAVIATISGIQIYETMLIALLGGIAAYLGQLLVKAIIQQIKKTIKP
jgi:hypothetical protein